MHDLVAAADGASLKEMGLPIGSRHKAPRFADEERAGGDVPGIQASLPEGVESTGCDIGQIERRAAHPPHIDDSAHYGRKLGSKSRVLRRLAKMRNAVAEDRLRQVAAPGDTQPAIAAKRA